MNDILPLRKMFFASSLPHNWAKCSSGTKKYENSAYDGGGIDSPLRAPAPELFTSSPWFNSSSEESSTTYAVFTLVINTSCVERLRTPPALNRVDGGLVGGLVRDDLEVH